MSESPKEGSFFDQPTVPTSGLEGEILQATFVERGDDGYHHSLSNLQIQMIAIGGAIGVGLFLGVGARLQSAGPALIVSYLIVGSLVYALMRALGQMVLYRPTTGAFVSYAREFVSDRFAHMTGWIYVTLAALAGIAELAAIGVYVKFWLPDLPTWIPSLVAIGVIAGVNFLSVKAFGTIELAAAGVKVVAIILFLITGLGAVLLTFFGRQVGQASVSHLWDHGGFFPKGIWAVIVVMQGVVFSFSAVEIVGISAGEAKDPLVTMPKAINSVIVRIGLFYIGAILVLSMLLPSQQYSGKESPFVTALGSLGVTGLAGVMNFVVLTAAISGVNATLYAAVRLLRNLAANGRAPSVTNRMSSRGVPVGALTSIGTVFLLGVILIFFAGASDAFEIVLGAVAVFILFGWIAIFVSHLGFLKAVDAGRVPRPVFRAGGKRVDVLCLAFLGALALWMIFDTSNPHWYYALIGAVVLLGGLTLMYEYYSRKHPVTPST
ncbi:MAG: amino acid permease [Actinomycetales bacterium]|nr:amino acid permease [Actinomycetales bacterium]